MITYFLLFPLKTVVTSYSPYILTIEGYKQYFKIQMYQSIIVSMLIKKRWINARKKKMRSTTDQSFFLSARESKACQIVVILTYFWFRILGLKFNTGMSFIRKKLQHWMPFCWKFSSFDSLTSVCCLLQNVLKASSILQRL